MKAAKVLAKKERKKEIHSPRERAKTHRIFVCFPAVVKPQKALTFPLVEIRA